MSGSRLGFKRYISWNDAIYGYSGYRININYYIPTNSLMVTRGYVSISLVKDFLSI